MMRGPPPLKDNTGAPHGGISVGVGQRKKAPGVRRPWLLLDSMGQAQVVEAGKHYIMRRTGLPAQDLRILDPLLSYPSTVLGRERAILVNLEHIKAIIKAQEVLLLNARDPSVAPFAEELQRRVLHHHQAACKSQETGVGGYYADCGDVFALRDSQLYTVSHPSYSESFRSNGGGKQEVVENRDGLKLLPFEFVALEACLETSCSYLDMEAKTLEQEAYPALDKLTSKISTLNLERVRQIKSRLVAITGRVQKVRDELEHLLDDDEDMAEMYLSDKLLQVESSSVSSMNEQDGMDDEVKQSDMNDKIPDEISLEGNAGSTSYYAYPEIDHPPERVNTLGQDNHRTCTSTKHSASISMHLDVRELEMLLEAYFVQIDGTLNRLSTLNEYVDDTEDFINIMLDDKQNHLLQMGVVMTTATLVVTAFVATVGMLSINIHFNLFNPALNGMPQWLQAVSGGSAIAFFLYISAIAWYKHKKYLD